MQGEKLLVFRQSTLTLPPFPRGFHLITSAVENALPEMPKVGLCHLFLQHTSAGLTLNENADPSVRVDFEGALNRVFPEDHPDYTHTYEGSDDMPGHLKSSMTGVSLTIPITDGRLNLGTWQGIYLCEYRNRGGRRSVVLTVQGSD
jgi:secondary thiamine-phosphate synthase enzyme